MSSCIVFSSCQKDDGQPTPESNETSQAIFKVEDKYLIRFLSTNLNVPIEEIKFNSDKTSILVYSNQLDRAEMEQLYLDANEYHLNYGK
ncbi:hypothetical protein PBAL39_07045 [Pedobacter sp. BAL39]|uniref:hypothetical protein n=1 Tax=Pedobacter sp. BAL39 TaxID=391596 RepID=UPI000155B179|nr:hypothetical protein [Pedobacter sp. BAL39]EDM34039.1 hypothetical protein PBAL39_07045 [Pedobacter sp. BAL39]